MIYFCAVYLLWVQIALLLFVRREALRALLSALISRFVFVEIIRLFYHRPRPYIVQNIQPLIDVSSWSFPSGHAAFMFALATVVFLKNKKIGIVMYVLAVLTGVARVLAHVHWSSDVIVGAILGILVALGIEMLYKRYGARGGTWSWLS